jgi:hypothetical protein
LPTQNRKALILCKTPRQLAWFYKKSSLQS